MSYRNCRIIVTVIKNWRRRSWRWREMIRWGKAVQLFPLRFSNCIFIFCDFFFETMPHFIQAVWQTEIETNQIIYDEIVKILFDLFCSRQLWRYSYQGVVADVVLDVAMRFVSSHVNKFIPFVIVFTPMKTVNKIFLLVFCSLLVVLLMLPFRYICFCTNSVLLFWIIIHVYILVLQSTSHTDVMCVCVYLITNNGLKNILNNMQRRCLFIAMILLFAQSCQESVPLLFFFTFDLQFIQSTRRRLKKIYIHFHKMQSKTIQQDKTSNSEKKKTEKLSEEQHYVKFQASKLRDVAKKKAIWKIHLNAYMKKSPVTFYLRCVNRLQIILTLWPNSVTKHYLKITKNQLIRRNKQNFSLSTKKNHINNDLSLKCIN